MHINHNDTSIYFLHFYIHIFKSVKTAVDIVVDSSFSGHPLKRYKRTVFKLKIVLKNIE